MTKLYPLKFKPIFKETIWGGNKLRMVLNKKNAPLDKCGESWELSNVQGDISVVSNGFLAGNDLQELIEIYMGDLVGDEVYEKFGNEFPLLAKFIDADDVLSIQVHPNDEMAKERHNAYGKTEMWYIVETEEGAELIIGFNKKIDRKTYLEYFEQKRLSELLNVESTQAGDVFFVPAGRIHSIGKGILVAEIQQTSDIIYRIYDFERKDAHGNSRPLHTELALDAIDYNAYPQYKTFYKVEKNKSSSIVDCKYFTTNIIDFDKKICLDYNHLDSFVMYMCLEGEFTLKTDFDTTEVIKGETVLLPAVLKNISLLPKEASKILETYISL